MKKIIKISYQGQSKALVSGVEIEYEGDTKEYEELGLTTNFIKEELQQIYKEIDKYAKTETFEKNK